MKPTVSSIWAGISHVSELKIYFFVFAGSLTFSMLIKRKSVWMCVCEKLNDHIRTTLYHTKREKLRVLIGWSFSELLQLLNVDGSDFTDTPPIWGCQSHSWILYETLQKKSTDKQKKNGISMLKVLWFVLYFLSYAQAQNILICVFLHVFHVKTLFLVLFCGLLFMADLNIKWFS